MGKCGDRLRERSWNNFKRRAPVDRSSSRDTAAVGACCCCCDGADAAACCDGDDAACSSRPSSRCRRVPPHGTDATAAQHQLRRSSISSVAAAAAGDGSVLRPLGSPSNGQPLDGFPTRFLAQKTLVTLKKRGPNKKLFLARRACTSGNRIYIVVITV